MLSLSLVTGCNGPLPPGHTYRWQYATAGGYHYPLDPSGGLFRANITVAVPFALNTTDNIAALVFGVSVHDPRGSTRGSMLGGVPLLVHNPSDLSGRGCREASIWQRPALHLRCQGPRTQDYLRSHVLPAVQTCGAQHRSLGEVLVLLQTLREGVVLRLLGAVDAGVVACFRSTLSGVAGPRSSCGIPALLPPLTCHVRMQTTGRNADMQEVLAETVRFSGALLTPQFASSFPPIPL